MTLEQTLQTFIEDAGGDLVLFVGAGVSARLGVPTWTELLHRLANQLEPVEKPSADLIRLRADNGDLLQAADYFWMSSALSPVRKRAILAEALEVRDVSGLGPLMSLGFHAIATTNFDRSLHSAWAQFRQSDVRDLGWNDSSLSTAIFDSASYIARIHGKAEMYETIAMTSEMLRRVSSSDSYVSYLSDLFLRRRLLFIGYSFLDPAIKSVMSAVLGRYAHRMTTEHLAIIPSSAPPRLNEELRKLNVESVRYDDSNGHDELWSAIKACAGKSNPSPTKGLSIEEQIASTRRYVAASLVRLNSRDEIAPLRHTVIEGIVAAILRESPHGLKRPNIKIALREVSPVTPDEAERIVAYALDELVSDGSVVFDVDSETYIWDGSDEDPFQSAVLRLVEGTVNRYAVRTGRNPPEQSGDFLESLVEHIILHRGWDLGAAFATHSIPPATDVAELAHHLSPTRYAIDMHTRDELLSAFANLITHPDVNEAESLVEIGRVAFAFNMISKAPKQVLRPERMLPERLMLDANILLRFIVKHHPNHSGVAKSLRSVRGIRGDAGSGTEIFVMGECLREVVFHRSKALEDYEALSAVSETTIEITRHLLGADGINVFVAGFLSYRRSGGTQGFHHYLDAIAPFKTDTEFATWLMREYAIKTVRLGAFDKPLAAPDISLMLQQSYESIPHLTRAIRTIENDAVQLGYLSELVTSGVNACLLTLDRRMISAVARSKFASLGSHILTHLGLAQLIDLISGRSDEGIDFARLMWSAKISDEHEAVREAIINQALKSYDDVLVKALPDLLEQFSQTVVDEANRVGVDLMDHSPQNLARILSLIEGFEENFFANFREALNKKH